MNESFGAFMRRHWYGAIMSFLIVSIVLVLIGLVVLPDKSDAGQKMLKISALSVVEADLECQNKIKELHEKNPGKSVKITEVELRVQVELVSP